MKKYLFLLFFVPLSAYAQLATGAVSSYKLQTDSTDVVSSFNGSDTAITYGTLGGNTTAQFDGSTSRIDTTHTPLTGTTDFTICAWIYPNAIGSQMVVANNRKAFPDDNSGIWYWDVDSSGKMQFWDYDAGAFGFSPSSMSSTALSATSWNFVCFVRSGTGGTYYLNGSADGTNSGSSVSYSTNATDHSLKIGVSGESGSYFNGGIADMTIFNTAKSSSDITSLYHSGTFLYYPFTTGGGGGLGSATYYLDDLVNYPNNCADSVNDQLAVFDSANTWRGNLGCDSSAYSIASWTTNFGWSPDTMTLYEVTATSSCITVTTDVPTCSADAIGSPGTWTMLAGSSATSSGPGTTTQAMVWEQQVMAINVLTFIGSFLFAYWLVALFI